MPKIIKPENKQHWLQMKSKDISSTEISALFGISPYMTEFELWHQKKAGDITAIDETERMRWGKRLEDAIAQGISEDLDINVRRLKTYQRHTDINGMGSSFDYEIVSHDKGPGILEIKNVDFLIYRDTWEEDEAPPHIEAQLQHQLELTNRDWGIIAALVSGNEIHYIERERNKEVGKAIRNRITDFWLSIKNNQPPDPDYLRDADFINDLYGQANNWMVDVSEDDEIRPLIEQFAEVSARYKEEEDAKKVLKAKILSLVQGNAKKLFCGDLSISCPEVQDTPPVVVTEDMVGTEIGGRKGYRLFRLYKKKPAKKKVAKKKTAKKETTDG